MKKKTSLEYNLHSFLQMFERRVWKTKTTLSRGYDALLSDIMQLL